MTVSSTTNRWAYAGDGESVSFTYDNRIFAAADLKVYVADGLKSLGSDYTLTGIGQPGGGQVLFAVAPADEAPVVLVRDVPATQGLDLVALGSFPAEENEKALDRLTVLVQQLIDASLRSLRQPLADATAIAALPARDTRKGKILGFNAATGDPEAATVSGQVLVADDGIAIDGSTIRLAPSTLGSVTPASGDKILLGDTSDGDAIKVALAADVLALVAVSPAVSAQTADFTAGNAASNVLYVVTPAGASADCTLPAASSVADGFFVRVKNQTDGKGVRLLRAASDTIDGQTSLRVPGREEVEVTRTASGAWAVSKRPSGRVGQVIEWGSNTLPEGGFAWLNAQALSRTDYRGLFDEWGTTYGAGDGSTTFNVRDDRGRVKAGKDDMGGASAANRLTVGGAGVAGTTLGASGGSQTHTLSMTEMPSHSHSIVKGTSTAQSALTLMTDGTYNEPPNTQAFAGVFTSSAGGSGTHQNTQPTIISNFIVKA